MHSKIAPTKGEDLGGAEEREIICTANEEKIIKEKERNYVLRSLKISD